MKKCTPCQQISAFYILCEDSVKSGACKALKRGFFEGKLTLQNVAEKIGSKNSTIDLLKKEGVNFDTFFKGR